jgi:hypothetical protein
MKKMTGAMEVGVRRLREGPPYIFCLLIWCHPLFPTPPRFETLRTSLKNIQTRINMFFMSEMKGNW